MTGYTLEALGWSDHFARQLTERETGEAAECGPARVSEIHRDRLTALAPKGELRLIPREPAGAYAVGDWVLTDGVAAQRRLAPVTDLTRRAAGHAVAEQRIAANVDTLGIVTSCNEDFNLPRLERYLALAEAAGCLPLIILTKADLCDDPGALRRQAERLSPLVTVLTLDARDQEEAAQLAPWCGKARTLALLGSSGVGKTTLRNALTGERADTRAIREQDARGRHTTTSRALRPTRAGGWLVDTPGMRELQLAEAGEGIGAVFADIEDLAAGCRFSDCAHDREPGCAVKAALEAGTLDPARLARWRKLLREDRHNSEEIATARKRRKAFGRVVKEAKAHGRRKRDVER